MSLKAIFFLGFFLVTYLHFPSQVAAARELAETSNTLDTSNNKDELTNGVGEAKYPSGDPYGGYPGGGYTPPVGDPYGGYPGGGYTPPVEGYTPPGGGGNPGVGYGGYPIGGYGGYPRGGGGYGGYPGRGGYGGYPGGGYGGRRRCGPYGC
ncbi:uncharacterized protein [Primulina eburnea]|uniref:uncharacterized protein isoform X2 n=1 Tax=Primulina eburnea TaxID=1245227 RepID=UPI003C6BDB15